MQQEKWIVQFISRLKGYWFVSNFFQYYLCYLFFDIFRSYYPNVSYHILLIFSDEIASELLVSKNLNIVLMCHVYDMSHWLYHRSLNTTCCFRQQRIIWHLCFEEKGKPIFDYYQLFLFYSTSFEMFNEIYTV